MSLRFSVVALIAALALTGLGGYLITKYGEAKDIGGFNRCMNKVQEAKEKDEARHQENQKELRRLSDPDLVRLYCEWVRGIPYDQCVQSYRFVP